MSKYENPAKILAKHEERKKQYWELLRLNLDYLRIYKKFSKSKNKKMADACFENLIGRFPIMEFIDPKRNFDDEINHVITLGQVWYLLPNSSYREPTNYEFEFVPINGFNLEKKLTIKTEKGKRSHFLFGGRFLRLDVDITQPLQYCELIVSRAIANAQKKLVKDVKKTTEKIHKSAFNESLKALHLHLKGYSFKIIGEKIWPNYKGDSTQKAKNVVKRINGKISSL